MTQYATTGNIVFVIFWYFRKLVRINSCTALMLFLLFFCLLFINMIRLFVVSSSGLVVKILEYHYNSC